MDPVTREVSAERKGMWERLGHVFKKKRPDYESPDPTPMAPPIGYKKQPSLSDQIRDMVRSEHLRQAAEAAGQESFEEADDFDIGDDADDPMIRMEKNFDPDPVYARKAAEKAKGKKKAEPPVASPAAGEKPAQDAPKAD